VAHFGGAAGAFIGFGGGGWIGPLIALVSKGNLSPTVRAHAVAALNFQLLCTIVAIAGALTVCIGIGLVLLLAAWVVGTVFGIIGGVKAQDGSSYKYPITVNMIK
jgi:uncharacterized Tic20 family protein